VASVKDKITVLFSITDLERHGVQHQVLELVKRLDKERFRAVVLNLSNGGPMEGEYKAILGNNLIFLERRGRYDFTCLFRVCHILRNMKVDIIQPFLTPATFFSLLPAIVCRTPVKVVTERNSVRDKDYGGLGYRLYLRVEDFLTRFVDWAVANSQAGKEYLIERGIKPSRTRVIYNGIDTGQFICDNEAAAKLRRKLDLGSDSKVVGMVARMFPAKRHDNFLRAAAIINRAIPETKFALLGDGPMRGYLENLSQELGLAANVIFLGEQQDVIPYISIFDIVALSSETEGLSLSICEAMALRKPVVATNVGGNQELVEDGNTGFLVPSGDNQAFAEAVIRLLKEPGIAQAMGQRAREKVAQQLGLERYVNEYQTLYEETLRRKNRG
jgi:glycosyltransferase involved in cell wall biosynthesis